MNNLKSIIEIDVINAMNPENHTYLQNLPISYFQTLGHLRAKIAQELGIHINQFHLCFKNMVVDPDADDEKFFRELTNIPTKCNIKLNQHYDPRAHPKYALAKSQEYFSVIFSMLQAS